MFSRLNEVTNLTVDYTRQASISIISETTKKSDHHEIISSLTLSAIGVIIAFARHAT